MAFSTSSHNIVNLLIFCLYGYVNAYPNGNVVESCSSMTPNHGVSAQASNAPYSLTVSKTTYSAGEQILDTSTPDFQYIQMCGIICPPAAYSASFHRPIFTLSGSSQFKGFLIQARSGSSTTPLGSFQVTDNTAQTLTCSTTASAVSQTASSSKSNIQVKWLAPSSGNSDIQLRATVVQSERVFWTNVASCTITYNSTSASIPGTSCTNSNSFRISASVLLVVILTAAIMWL